MNMRNFVLVMLVVAMSCFAFSAEAAESQFDKIVKKNWTPENVKQALLNNPRLTQKQLDEALFDALNYSGASKIIRLLLDAGANPNAERHESPSDGPYATPEDFYSPIVRTAQFEDWDSFVVLANAGANIKGDLSWGSAEGDPSNLPHYVAFFGNDAAVIAMVNRGIDKTEKDNNLTPYDYAKKNKNLSPNVREMLR